MKMWKKPIVLSVTKTDMENCVKASACSSWWGCSYWEGCAALFR